MFTGIVEELGVVRDIAGTTLRIAGQKMTEDLKLGDSVAVNGVCLTVIDISMPHFAVEVMPETLRRSNLGNIVRGDRVNLERALALGGRIGGHLVQGHVDATGRIVSLIPEGNAILLRVTAPQEVARYLVEKAFIAVDGISLTIASCEGSAFTASIVGFTLHNTTIGLRKPGHSVNLEVDVVARYIEHFNRSKGSGLTMDLLLEHGFRATGRE